MKKVYRKKMDDEGISGISAIIILVIIGLLVWEFALPMLDENIPSFSSYFRTPEDELTGKWSILNENTGFIEDVHTSWTGETIFSDGENYSVIITSNVPWSIISPPYYFQIEIYTNSQLSSTFEQEVQYTALYTDTFSFSLGLDFSSSTVDYQIYARILDSEKTDTGILYSHYFLLGD